MVVLAFAASMVACGEGGEGGVPNAEHRLLTGDNSTPVASLTSALSDSLVAYAQKCDSAIGVTVPDFVCDDGTEVPTTNLHADGTCDRPNRLNEQCDPGSRFQVLSNTADAYVVAHCRKRGAEAGIFRDIAVIQYNKRSGATCFYQALQPTLDGRVKAPSKGSGVWPWLSPSATADIKCVRCHDNGPIVRSPYLTQVTGANKLPGAGDPGFNRDQPYYFVGNDFASWKAFKVEVAGNMCNGCHRMGTSNMYDYDDGGALDLGIRATAMSETAKNPHSAASPIWMTPNQITYDATKAAAAQAIRDCALHRNDNPLPSSPACSITQYTATPPPTVPGRFAAVWAKNTSSEIQVYGASYAAYRNKYDQLWDQGFRLFSLQPYVVDGAVLYNAVWRPSTEGEFQIYGATYAQFRARYDALWGQGWRLKLIQPYVVNGAVFYTAVWRPSSEGEYQIYGATYAELTARYDQLWPQGWRLKILEPYVVDGTTYFTAVWRRSTSGEIQIYDWSYDDYRAEYDALWEQGWRLKILRAY